MSSPFIMKKMINQIFYMRKLIAILLLISFAACSENKPAPLTKKEEPKADTVNVFILNKDSVQRTLSIPRLL